MAQVIFIIRFFFFFTISSAILIIVPNYALGECLGALEHINPTLSLDTIIQRARTVVLETKPLRQFPNNLPQHQDTRFVAKELARSPFQIIDPLTGFRVFGATAHDLSPNHYPVTLHELGRARQESFRQVGEGTDQPEDLDIYDNYFFQLIATPMNSSTIAASYRIGFGDKIFMSYGLNGFYSFQHFEFGRPLQKALPQTMELGRAFTSIAFKPESISRKSPLLTVLSAIAKIITTQGKNEINPKLKYPYRYFLAEVSIGSHYSPIVKQIIVEWLLKNRKSLDIGVGTHVRPEYKPFTPPLLNDDEIKILTSSVRSLTELNELIIKIQGNVHLGLPPLIKLCESLGAKFISASEDHDFGSIDLLVIIDAAKMESLGFHARSQERTNEFKLSWAD